MHYVDYVELDMNDTDALAPFMYRRLSFEHANEVRLAHWSSTPVKVDPFADIGAKEGRIAHDAGSGVRVGVDLDNPVKEVFVAPDAEPWLRPLIERLTGKNRLKAPVIQSNLCTGPIS